MLHWKVTGDSLPAALWGIDLHLQHSAAFGLEATGESHSYHIHAGDARLERTGARGACKRWMNSLDIGFESGALHTHTHTHRRKFIYIYIMHKRYGWLNYIVICFLHFPKALSIYVDNNNINTNCFINNYQREKVRSFLRSSSSAFVTLSCHPVGGAVFRWSWSEKPFKWHCKRCLGSVGKTSSERFWSWSFSWSEFIIGRMGGNTSWGALIYADSITSNWTGCIMKDFFV